MVTDFIQQYAELIVNHTDKLDVQLNEIEPDFCEITVYAHADDLGKLIGKSGNMINALKTILNGCKAKDGKSYKIQVERYEEA